MGCALRQAEAAGPLWTVEVLVDAADGPPAEIEVRPRPADSLIEEVLEQHAEYGASVALFTGGASARDIGGTTSIGSSGGGSSSGCRGPRSDCCCRLTRMLSSSTPTSGRIRVWMSSIGTRLRRSASGSRRKAITTCGTRGRRRNQKQLEKQLMHPPAGLGWRATGGR